MILFRLLFFLLVNGVENGVLGTGEESVLLVREGEFVEDSDSADSAACRFPDLLDRDGDSDPPPSGGVSRDLAVVRCVGLRFGAGGGEGKGRHRGVIGEAI